MARRSATIGLGVLVVGLLVAGALGALLVDFDDDDDEAVTPTTTTLPAETTTTAPGETTTTTAPGATTTVPSGLAEGGTGRAGDTDGVTPATGGPTGWLAAGGLLSLVLATLLHRYTRERSGAFERP